jgi:hypothetical protein
VVDPSVRLELLAALSLPCTVEGHMLGCWAESILGTLWLYNSLEVSNHCFLFRRIYWSKFVCTDIYIPYIVYKYQCAPHQQNYLLLAFKEIEEPCEPNAACTRSTSTELSAFRSPEWSMRASLFGGVSSGLPGRTTRSSFDPLPT